MHNPAASRHGRKIGSSKKKRARPKTPDEPYGRREPQRKPKSSQRAASAPKKRRGTPTRKRTVTHRVDKRGPGRGVRFSRDLAPERELVPGVGQALQAPAKRKKTTGGYDRPGILKKRAGTASVVREMVRGVEEQEKAAMQGLASRFAAELHAPVQRREESPTPPVMPVRQPAGGRASLVPPDSSPEVQAKPLTAPLVARPKPGIPKIDVSALPEVGKSEGAQYKRAVETEMREARERYKKPRRSVSPEESPQQKRQRKAKYELPSARKEVSPEQKQAYEAKRAALQAQGGASRGRMAEAQRGRIQELEAADLASFHFTREKIGDRRAQAGRLDPLKEFKAPAKQVSPAPKQPVLGQVEHAKQQFDPEALKRSAQTEIPRAEAGPRPDEPALRARRLAKLTGKPLQAQAVEVPGGVLAPRKPTEAGFQTMTDAEGRKRWAREQVKRAHEEKQKQGDIRREFMQKQPEARSIRGAVPKVMKAEAVQAPAVQQEPTPAEFRTMTEAQGAQLMQIERQKRKAERLAGMAPKRQRQEGIGDIESMALSDPVSAQYERGLSQESERKRKRNAKVAADLQQPGKGPMDVFHVLPEKRYKVEDPQRLAMLEAGARAAQGSASTRSPEPPFSDLYAHETQVQKAAKGQGELAIPGAKTKEAQQMPIRQEGSEFLQEAAPLMPRTKLKGEKRALEEGADAPAAQRIKMSGVQHLRQREAEAPPQGGKRRKSEPWQQQAQQQIEQGHIREQAALERLRQQPPSALWGAARPAQGEPGFEERLMAAAPPAQTVVQQAQDTSPSAVSKEVHQPDQPQPNPAVAQAEPSGTGEQLASIVKDPMNRQLEALQDRLHQTQPESTQTSVIAPPQAPTNPAHTSAAYHFPQTLAEQAVPMPMAPQRSMFAKPGGIESVAPEQKPVPDLSQVQPPAIPSVPITAVQMGGLPTARIKAPLPQSPVQFVPEEKQQEARPRGHPGLVQPIPVRPNAARTGAPRGGPPSNNPEQVHPNDSIKEPTRPSAPANVLQQRRGRQPGRSAFSPVPRRRPEQGPPGDESPPPSPGGGPGPRRPGPRRGGGGPPGPPGAGGRGGQGTGTGGGASVNLNIGGFGGGGGGASASASAAGASGAGGQGAQQAAGVLLAALKKPKRKQSGITAAKKRYTDKRKVKLGELRALKSKRIREHKAKTKKMKPTDRSKSRAEFKKRVDGQFREVTKRFPTARGLKDLQTVRQLIDKIERVRLPS